MPTISATTPKADKGSSISDPTPLNPMAPLTLAQDRLARGQNPGSPSRRPGPKSPVKSRIPKGLPPNNEAKDRRQLELKDELTQGAKENEMWEESQQRHKAAVMLGSWEIVTWYGIAGDEVRLSHAPFTFSAVSSHCSYPLSVLSCVPTGSTRPQLPSSDLQPHPSTAYLPNTDLKFSFRVIHKRPSASNA